MADRDVARAKAEGDAATLVEEGNSQAIVMDAAGAIDVCAEGEQLQLAPAGMRVDRVEADKVTLTHNGQPLVLKMQPFGAP